MFTLEEITTSDGLIHQGIVASPTQNSTTVIIWIHGLTGTFYGNIRLLQLFGEECVKQNITFASFNNRGHDMISGFRKVDQSPKGYMYTTVGAGYEVFEESIQDIQAQISYFKNKGYTHIFLAGHSSGANKVSYYSGLQGKDISGVVLVCPMSDRLDPSANKEEIEQNLQKCFALVEQGRGDALVTGLHFFPMTAKRYISLVTPNTSEDQFGYGDSPPMMTDYQRISVPLLTIFAEKDEYADRPVEEIKKVFDAENKSSNYTSFTIPDSLHSLTNKEPVVVSEIIAWIRKIA